MRTPDRPKLRPFLEAEDHDDDMIAICDPRRVGRSVIVSPLALALIEQFDGMRTCDEIAKQALAANPRLTISADAIARLAAALDEALLLESPRLGAFFATPVRPAACIGTYSADPAELRRQLDRLFTDPDGPGVPEVRRVKSGGPPSSLRAVLVPHMDYGRGNATYGHGFKELIENTDAIVFVIVATAHHTPHRFTLTRQHFDTPLGLVETDADYITAIAEQYGEGLFDDPAAHVPEHSIELEVVLLQHLLGGRRPFRIVPLLVGPMQDWVRKRKNPAGGVDIARMVAALQSAEAACPVSVCYVISGDLAHVGPQFDDRRKAAGPWLVESREKDAAILRTLEAADATAFFDIIAAESNARRICGLSPTWLTLEVTKPRIGKVLHYQQYAHPEGRESVSFAAAAFYGSDASAIDR